MQHSFQEDTSCLTIICKTYNQLYIEEHKLAEHFYQDASRSSTKLLETDSKNVVGLFTKGIILEQENKILQAREIILESKISESTPF